MGVGRKLALCRLEPVDVVQAVDRAMEPRTLGDRRWEGTDVLRAPDFSRLYDPKCDPLLFSYLRQAGPAEAYFAAALPHTWAQVAMPPASVAARGAYRPWRKVAVFCRWALRDVLEVLVLDGGLREPKCRPYQAELKRGYQLAYSRVGHGAETAEELNRKFGPWWADPRDKRETHHGGRPLAPWAWEE